MTNGIFTTAKFYGFTSWLQASEPTSESGRLVIGCKVYVKNSQAKIQHCRDMPTGITNNKIKLK